MTKSFFNLLIISILSLSTLNASTISRKEFIRKYKHIAIKEMERTGIPASIKLAQGILESNCGASRLAQKAHNHFGIKCHDWTGPAFHMDDDEENECFRKYKNPEQSWIDHSNFLTNRPRYASLFRLPSTDYKAWAKGLKAAGYATNPRYAELLIKIIEEEQLYKYDRPGIIEQKEYAMIEKCIAAAGGINFSCREEMRNGLICVEAQPGDSYEKIAAYYNVKLKKLLKYNEKQDTVLRPGQLVFLKKKKKKAARGYDFHRVKPGDCLYDIAQQYGVRMDKIFQYNYYTSSSKLIVGDKVYLRGKAVLY